MSAATTTLRQFAATTRHHRRMAALFAKLGKKRDELAALKAAELLEAKLAARAAGSQP